MPYYLETLLSFLDEAQREYFRAADDDFCSEATLRILRDHILKTEPELLAWLSDLPCYYKTDTQVFVHAGVDEEAQELWELGTTEEYMLGKYPPTTGKFLITVIAGHVGSSEVSGDPSFHGIYFDGESHYFIDGTVSKSGRIPLLVYDPAEEKYSNI